ncbi:MAG TPA: hypothetical protein VHE99_08555 [Gammaproteobacteria bacterium]|nr:hypothetical protein [Gammaproteobacteria bacterium]
MTITPIRKQTTDIQDVQDIQNENRHDHPGSVVQRDPKRQTGNKPDRQSDRESFKDSNRKAGVRPVQNPDRGR